MLSEEKHVFARRVALGSFLLDTFFQTLALLSDAESWRSSPSAIYVAYSPHPYAPLGLFVLGLSCQILWLLKFYPVPISGEQGDEEVGSTTLSSSSSGHEQSRTEEPTSQTMEELSGADVHEVSRAPQEVPMMSIPLQDEDNDPRASTTTQPTIYEVVVPEPAQSRYLPFYMLGSLFQASWSVMWMTRHYDYCSILPYLNLAIALYILFGILEGSKNQRYPQASLFTHLVVKIRIAVSVLYLWKTWGAVDIVPPPSPAESILNCLIFIILSLSSGPDPTLGLLLVMILFSLALGQYHNLEWHLSFNWTAVTVFFIVLMDWAFGARIRRMCTPLWADSNDDDSQCQFF